MKSRIDEHERQARLFAGLILTIAVAGISFSVWVIIKLLQFFGVI